MYCPVVSVKEFTYLHHSIKMQISNAGGSPCMYLHTCYAYSCVLIQYKLSFLRHTHVLVIPHSGVIVYIISSYVRTYMWCKVFCYSCPALCIVLSMCVNLMYTVHTVNLYLSTVCHIYYSTVGRSIADIRIWPKVGTYSKPISTVCNMCTYL